MDLASITTWKAIYEMTWQTLIVTFLSTTLAYLLGLPVGVLLNATSKTGVKPIKSLHFVLGLIVNILRSIPCLIIIVLCIPLTRKIMGIGSGEWYTILIPMTITAFGLTARMVEQSLNEVPAGEIEAVKSLGASNWQLITKVIVPEAKASLITGISVVAVSILGYTSFAYNIGAGGLISGIYRYYANNTGDYLKSPYFWILIVIVVLIVQLIQELGLKIAKKIDKRRVLR